MNTYVRQFAIEMQRNGPLFALWKVATFLAVKIFGRLPKFGVVAHDPLISVLVVSYNSQEDLPECLLSIARQSYRKYEVVVVENGTSDTQALVHSILPEARWIRAEGNLGFAAGNDIGMEASRGEFVALVNPDTRLDEECLLELLHAFRSDGDLAVATPKTRFWTKFVDVYFESATPFSFEAAALERQLAYKKYFLRQGTWDATRSKITSRPELSRNGLVRDRILLRLPLDHTKLALAASGRSPVEITADASGAVVAYCKHQRIELSVSLRAEDHPGAGWIINNAGTGMRKGGPFDIGFGEKDELLYDKRRKVPAFCGCVALIRRAALVGRPIFRPEFFAYYEDSELSHDLGRLGYRIQYCPRAIVYHKHSVSSSEGSRLWNTLVERSRLIYERYRGKKGAQARLDAFLARRDRYEAVPLALAETLRTYDAAIGPAQRKGRTIGLYNSYWNTMGGGEAHALGVALAASEPDDEIFLISETDFDVDELGRRFGYDLDRCRKLVVTAMTRALTARFDIFINATFRSNLGSLAKRSLYIVSFPHQEIRRSILRDYVFLHNSRFTQSWAERYWGRNRGLVVYPTLSVAMPAPSTYAAKDRLVLSIGRITDRGHGKNQHSIIEAFRATAGEPGCADWRLCLVGSFDQSDVQDGTYLARITAMAESDPRIAILPNCPRAAVNELLAKAAIYVHAAGLGQPEAKPEYHEHFGIAPLEACLFGAWPIVYAKGGPADLVHDLKAGETYRELDGFVTVLRNVMSGKATIDHKAVAAAARAFCSENDGHFRSYLAGSVGRS